MTRHMRHYSFHHVACLMHVWHDSDAIVGVENRVNRSWEAQ